VPGDYVLSILVVAALGTLLGGYKLRVRRQGPAVDPRLAREPGTPLLGRSVVEAAHWALRGVGRAAVAAGLSPDAFTWLSLAITLGCLPLIAAGHLPAGGAVLLVGSACDALDGIVARARHVASDAGEMLDAFVDRLADAVPWAGLAIFYRSSVIAVLVVLGGLLGCLMVSYVRAKAEAMQLDLPPGLMRRHERIAYVALALIVGPLVPGRVFGAIDCPGTLALLGLVTLLCHYSAFRSMRQARALLALAGRGPGGNHGNR
jgi:CDP-diacylglycerol---glycerol-3-phosphate 3-phosphatidyltransferase